MYAYMGPGTVIPKSIPSTTIVFKGMQFATPQELPRGTLNVLKYSGCMIWIMIGSGIKILSFMTI